MLIAFHQSASVDFEAADKKLRAAGKAHLERLRTRQFGGIRVEKVTDAGLWELKISWNRQEFRFLFFYGQPQTVNVVHFFQKKSRKISSKDIDLGTGRMKEMQLDQSLSSSDSIH